MSGLEMRYFVLKPKGDSAYHHASRAALYAYADAIEDENAKLAADLRAWAGKEVARSILDAKVDLPANPNDPLVFALDSIHEIFKGLSYGQGRDFWVYRAESFVEEMKSWAADAAQNNQAKP